MQAYRYLLHYLPRTRRYDCTIFWNDELFLCLYISHQLYHINAVIIRMCVVRCFLLHVWKIEDDINTYICCDNFATKVQLYLTYICYGLSNWGLFANSNTKHIHQIRKVLLYICLNMLFLIQININYNQKLCTNDNRIYYKLMA